MSLDQPLICACPTNGLQVQVSEPDFLLLHCPRCDSILAGQPMPGESGPAFVQLLSLGEEESAQVRRAAGLDPESPLVEVLQRILSCTIPAALRVALQRLSQRSGLLGELGEALYGADPLAQLLTLQLISRMPQVPRELRPGALSAIQTYLKQEPLGEEARIALMALYPLATQAQHLRSAVERFVRDVEGLPGERPVMIRRIAAAVVTAMDRAAATTKERFLTARDQLAALVQEGQLDQARAVLVQAYPEEDPDDPDGGMTGRAALCEAAAQTLQGNPELRPAVGVLLKWALQHAEIFASWATAGGEGLARMVEVNRLRDRIAGLDA